MHLVEDFYNSGVQAFAALRGCLRREYLNWHSTMSDKCRRKTAGFSFREEPVKRVTAEISMVQMSFKSWHAHNIF